MRDVHGTTICRGFPISCIWLHPDCAIKHPYQTVCTRSLRRRAENIARGKPFLSVHMNFVNTMVKWNQFQWGDKDYILFIRFPLLFLWHIFSKKNYIWWKAWTKSYFIRTLFKQQIEIPLIFDHGAYLSCTFWQSLVTRDQTSQNSTGSGV